MLDVKCEVNTLSTLREEDVLTRITPDINPNNVKKAVELYNQAVESIQTNSSDIAAIELKKSISLYRDFIEAKILLSLCYLIGQQLDEAEHVLEGILEQHNAVAKVHQYIYYINDIKGKGKKDKTKTLINISHSKQNIIKVSVGFVAGIIITCILLYGSVASMNLKKSLEAAKLEDDYKSKIVDYDTNLLNAQNKIDSLQQQLEEKSDNDHFSDKVSKLLEIEYLIKKGQNEQAANALLPLKDIAFTGVEQDKYTELYNLVIPKQAKKLYYDGYTEYEAGRYQEALPLLEKSITYDSGSDVAPNAMYFAARCYQKSGDNVKATNYFQRIKSEFPNDAYAGHASSRLREIGIND